ncbi:MAG: helix-turn-helix domain-containing protein [Acidobacteria bacterium]|nr:helix-turn-helix domain-containing protein [Acidobacteriota bacterium]
MGNIVALHSAQIDPDDPVSFNDVPRSQVYTVRQVAALLGINIGITYDLVRAGEIPAKRLGKRWIIPKQLFHSWLNDPRREAR